MDHTLLLASQLIVMAVSWGTATCLVVAFVRRRDVRAAWVPVVATLGLLVSTGFIATAASTPMAAAWFVCFPVLCFTYPDGRLRPRWTIIPLAVSVIGTAAYIATDSQITDAAWWPFAAGAQTLLGVGVLIYRYSRRLSADDRMRLRWPLLAVIVEVSIFAVIMLAEGGTVAEHGPLSVAAANLAGLWIGPGFAIGLAWPRLLNVDRALRGVLVVVFTAIPLAAACAVVIALSSDLGASAAWLTALAVAILAVPLTRLSAHAADRLVFRRRADPLSSLRELGARLDAQLDLTAVPHTLVALIHEALGFEEVVLRGPGEVEVRVGEPNASATTEFPVMYRGERLAVLVVSPRRTELTLTAHDAAVVDELVRQSAPALHGVRTFAELVDAREHLQRLRQSERARMRRDLHDDLAPTLAGLGLSATAIAALTADRPAVARLAETLREDAGAALAQVRELTHDLRPEALDQDGLLITLQRRLVRDGTAGPQVRVTGPEGEFHLDPRVEVAALRIAQEAVSNARRHAEAAQIAVRVGLDPTSLLVEVRDDGVGLAENRTAGLGLESMRQRARELGGATVISPALGGGTVVRARLPLEPVPAPDAGDLTPRSA
ncbi:hypothetical protein ASD65_03385 [Microbacterium sp. Root61]|uniref:sensor histidine kinase n=1 Tax=Microbacterium sp. Root61 TaxID=1736570 RepID=UPI0006F7A7BC|nr:sensor histidine kinase [Microbacterium sp. Root61]KRA23571.1 hypothetical protein ASD65_03385 [Microbacterium sp. Root61]